MIRSSLRRFGNFLISIGETPRQNYKAPALNSRDSSDEEPPFEQRATQLIAASKDGLLGGSIQLLGLNEIIKNSATNKPGIVKAALRIAEDTIRKHLTVDDIFQKYDDETFILVFGKVDSNKAEIITKNIADEIRDKLENNEFLSKIDVSFSVVKTDKSILETRQGLVVDVIADNLRKVKDEATNALQAWRQEVIKDAKTLFSPVWDPNKKNVSTYRAIIDLGNANNSLKNLLHIANKEEIRLVLFDLDCLVLGGSLQSLHSILGNSGYTSFIIPINFNNLIQKGTRDKFITLCQNITDSYQKYIIFEVHSVPAGTPIMRITDIVGLLKRYTSGIIMDFQKESAQLRGFSEAGILGISFDAKFLPKKAEDTKRLLAKLVSTAHTFGLKFFLNHADTVGFVESAILAKADYVDGKGIALPVSSPKSSYGWHLPVSSRGGL